MEGSGLMEDSVDLGFRFLGCEIERRGRRRVVGFRVVGFRRAGEGGRGRRRVVGFRRAGEGGRGRGRRRVVGFRHAGEGGRGRGRRRVVGKERDGEHRADRVARDRVPPIGVADRVAPIWGRRWNTDG
ncbi:hypothetical protein I3760_06G050400 [Carya illinoinensis]|nr:hypothetical protein I3760_06G050400 [Carya illinoinensis]